MRAFTLLEVLMYCGVYSLLLTGILSSTALIIDMGRSTREEVRELQSAMYREYKETTEVPVPKL